MIFSYFLKFHVLSWPISGQHPSVNLDVGEIIPASVNSSSLNKCRSALGKVCGLSEPKSYSFILTGRKLFLGNEFIKIIVALACCEFFEIPRLMVANGSLFFRRNFVTKRGIRIEMGPGRYFRAPGARLFVYNFQLWDWDQCPAGYFLEISRSIRDEVLANLPKPTINASTLVMHLRAFDGFTTSVANNIVSSIKRYGQPTCNFYVDAMERNLGHDQVMVIAHDKANVCTERCADKGAILHLGGDLATDFALMLYSKRFVTSRSTLMRAVMYLSPVPKIWYYFGSSSLIDCGLDDWPWHIWSVFGPHQVCIASREFEDTVIMDWNWKKAELLKNEKCEWYLDTALLNESKRDTIRYSWNP
jgi:hypothetical protein